MTESELEDQDVIIPELLPAQRFEVMVKEASLDELRANYLLQNFSGHFKEAAEWARKAKDIIVTNENQTVMMEIARIGRLFLAKKLQEIEKARKWMKEPALREGQAIDKIANLLKDTIIPTEEHLRRQECFVEDRKKAEEERIRLEIEKRMAEEELEKQRKLSEEHARMQEENNRLKAERAKEAHVAEVKECQHQETARILREEKETKLQEERNKTLRIERELALRKQAELKAEADKIRAEEALLSSNDQDLMIILRKQLMDIKIPIFQSIINKRIAEDIKSYIGLAILKIKIIEEEE